MEAHDALERFDNVSEAGEESAGPGGAPLAQPP
jgi:hypothetical protein